jgi:uncharacterized membrane protein
MAETLAPPQMPEVNRITTADIVGALRAGLSDFARAPQYGLVIGAIFSLVGVVISLSLVRGGQSLWLLPIAAGFPLIGPFAATGLYEVSRRLETGERLDWGVVLGAGFRNSQLPLFAVFAVFAFLVWIVLARVIFAVSFGTAEMPNVMTSLEAFLTGPGILMLLIGTAVGAALAVLLFAVSALSVPMLVDRDIDVVTAMITSFGAVVENRDAMVRWALVIVAAVVVAMLPFFLGMVLVFPVLGHATWHVYRKAIAPA